jgi:hypothetical protein
MLIGALALLLLTTGTAIAQQQPGDCGYYTEMANTPMRECGETAATTGRNRHLP